MSTSSNPNRSFPRTHGFATPFEAFHRRPSASAARSAAAPAHGRSAPPGAVPPQGLPASAVLVCLARGSDQKNPRRHQPKIIPSSKNKNPKASWLKRMGRSSPREIGEPPLDGLFGGHHLPELGGALWHLVPVYGMAPVDD